MRVVAAVCIVASTAAYQPHVLPHGAVRARSRVITLGFFDEMKKGFEAGMGSPSSSSPPPSPVEQQSASPSIFESLKNLVNPEPLTEEEIIAKRIKAGEGVVWSADYSRAWRSKKGMPQDELSMEEAKQIAQELGVEIPKEVA